MKRFFLIFVILLSLTGCHADFIDEIKPATVTILAPESLQGPLEEINNLFKEEHSNITLDISYGKPQEQIESIENGAQVNLFIGTANRQIDELSQKDLIAPDTKQNVVLNTLVLIAPEDSKLETFKEISNYDIRKIAIGDPNGIPVGHYADEALKNLGLYSTLEDKLDTCSSVREIIQEVKDKQASCGFVYRTDTINQRGIKVVAEVPAASYTQPVYPMVQIKDNDNPGQTKFYQDFLLTEQAQQIFINYGFTRPGPPVEE